jgi:hypothetical protein
MSEAINGLNSFKIKIMLNNPEDLLYGLLIYYDVDVTQAV